MKRLLLFLPLVLLWAIPAHAQGGNTVTIRFAGAPTGGCNFFQYGVNNATGDLYDCKAGVWFKVGPASSVGFCTPPGVNHSILIDDGTGDCTDLGSLGTSTTLLHGNASGDPTFGAVVSADLNITTTSCTNQFLTAIGSTALGTCTTDVLASAQHANQGSTTTLLHGNGSGNPSWAAVSSPDLNITSTSCPNQFVTAISSTAVGTCTTATLASAQFINQGTTSTLLHGNAAGNPSFGAVVSADLNITTSTCTNQFVTALSASAAATCTTDVLASAQHANQGTTTTLLHGNGAGNPSFGAVNLAADITGQLPIGNVGSAGLSGTSPIAISAAGAISCSTCTTGSLSFGNLTSGTNTVPAAMVIGNGSSLDVSGTGTNNATTLGGATFAAPGAIGGGTPGSGAFTTLGGTVITASTNVASPFYKTNAADPADTGVFRAGIGEEICWEENPAGTDKCMRYSSGNFSLDAALAVSGNVSASQLVSSVITGTAPLSVASTTNVPNLNASSLSGATFAAPGTIGGGTPGAATFTTLTANTSLVINGGTALTTTNRTGTGNLVLADGPTMTTPTLGVATATSINKVAITAPATSATLTILNGKTLTANKSITLEGTDATTMTFPTTSATITQTIASGTSALGTGAITSGACATVVTTTATGTATTDNIQADFNADPTATTGYAASANGMLTIIKYPTANNVNFKVCNNTSASVTPGAVTLNWRVVR